MSAHRGSSSTTSARTTMRSSGGGGTRVAYYNAQYVRALRLASSLAGWYGDGQRALILLDGARRRHGRRLRQRLLGRLGRRLPRHELGLHRRQRLDGNAFALLAGIASMPRCSRRSRTSTAPCAGATATRTADTNGWRGANWGDGDFQRVYPFILYFEVLARYGAGAETSALELIRREWGLHGSRAARERCGRRSADDSAAARSTATPSWDARLVERRRPGADELRARGAADLAGLRDLQRHAAPERADVRARDGADAARSAARLVADHPRQARTAGHGAAGHGLGQPGAAADGRSERRRLRRRRRRRRRRATTLKPLVKVKLASSLAKVTSQVTPRLRAAVRTTTGW